MMSFVHLHVHTQFSILDGACNIPRLIEKAKNDGMKAIAITDHGNMFGAKLFYDIAKKNGIKPIIGCEAYVAPDGRQNKDKNLKDNRGGYHIVLLAKNLKGYHNIIKLISYAWIDGYYYKPRIDKELLEKYHEGIIASSACLGGEIQTAILEEDIKKAEENLLYYKNIFGDDFYLEMQRHETDNEVLNQNVFERQKIVNEAFKELSEKHDVKLIATNDVHFINAEDAEAHDILICLNTNKDLDDKERMQYTREEFFKTQEEMNECFKDIPVAIANTAEVAEKIEDFELDQAPVMPDFSLPENFTDQNEYLTHITYEGAKRRYGEVTDAIKERIDYELSVIKKMGYPGYFLIVYDFLKAARERGVSVGPGRGSAAGSVVAYCNEITSIDPLKYRLLFERFLNPDRISMPDIDIDFDEEGREEVINYVVDKYGEQRVANLITYGTMAPRMAIRDVARVKKMPLDQADKLAKYVPERPNTSFKDAYSESKELRDAKKSDNELVSKTLSFAETLEGSIRQTGLHACGIIIGKNDLMEHIPVCKFKDSHLLVTQYGGNVIESVGMLKMDFLGLKTLSIIKDTIKYIKGSAGKDIDIDNIPLDDQETYELYAKGETTGLFQFESDGMKKHLRELKPNRFEDLIAMNALYRPGPMKYIPSFINRKHGKEKVEYDLPIMEEYLEETYGITVYQEQVMLLSQAMAGFSGGEADSLRKAMGKKNKALMEQMKDKFFEGCKKNEYDEKIIQKIWTDWEEFAEYAFNKSHSTCYAFISYQTGYLKAHYPAEFMATVLSRNLNDINKVTIFMDECRRMGIEVLGPDVNESDYKFTVNKNGNVRFGIGAIKGVGENAVAKIVEEREKNGPFKDIYDFVERVNIQTVNKKNIEALAKAGAFDNLSNIRRDHFFAEDEKQNTFTESLIRYGNKFQSEKNTSQNTLFGGTNDFAIAKPELPQAEEWGSLYKLNKEKEVIGIYLSAHPLDKYKFELDELTTNPLRDMHDMSKLMNRDITIGGLVVNAHKGTTKTGKPFGSLTIEDYTDTFKFYLFSKDFIQFKNFFENGYSLLISGKIQKKNWGDNKDEPEFKIREINLLNEAREKFIKSIALMLPLSGITENMISNIKEYCNGKGNTLLKFIVYDTDENIDLKMFSRNNKIQVSEAFIKFLNHNDELFYKVNV